ncbi:MAG: hypothetical protein WCV85_01850 [Patescibacteria group bacterium]|jgi:hypothetical protein
MAHLHYDNELVVDVEGVDYRVLYTTSMEPVDDYCADCRQYTDPKNTVFQGRVIIVHIEDTSAGNEPVELTSDQGKAVREAFLEEDEIIQKRQIRCQECLEEMGRSASS